jgi:hypothetical protein
VSYTDADFYSSPTQEAGPSPVTEYTVTLTHGGETATSPGSKRVLYPGTAGPNPWPADSSVFTTQYTGQW